MRLYHFCEKQYTILQLTVATNNTLVFLHPFFLLSFLYVVSYILLVCVSVSELMLQSRENYNMQFKNTNRTVKWKRCVPLL